MELPDIVPETPVEVPAVEAKTYPKLWLSRMIIEAPSPLEKATCYMQFIPYDGGGGVLQEPLTWNTIPDVFALAGTDPEFAQAMGAVIAMCNKYKSIDFSKPFTVDPVTYEVTQP